MQHVMMQPAEEHDCGLLALLNRELILAEQSDNVMSYVALEERMQTFLRGTYRAWLFRVDDVVIGYALVDMAPDPLYLRQFCIVEAYRGKGYGRAAFTALQQLLGHAAIDIDVLEWNRPGAAFWAKIGFAARYTRMRLHAGRIADAVIESAEG
jgi:predicted acetyltransferase